MGLEMEGLELWMLSKLSRRIGGTELKLQLRKGDSVKADLTCI